jgi:hypothetical protein
MSLPTDILLKKRGSDADIVCGSDDASIYDIKNSLDQTEAVKTAATDAAIRRKKCDDAMQTGFARIMSLMPTRETMEAAIRSSLIPR